MDKRKKYPYTKIFKNESWQSKAYDTGNPNKQPIE